MVDPDKIIGSRAGFSSSGIDRIKFGPGVVGKLLTAQMGLYIIMFSGVGAGTYLRDRTMIYAFGIGAVVSFFYSSLASMYFADKNPGPAILEGGELVRYRQVEMAAKDVDVPKNQENTVAPPVIEHRGTDA